MIRDTTTREQRRNELHDQFQIWALSLQSRTQSLGRTEPVHTKVGDDVDDTTPFSDISRGVCGVIWRLAAEADAIKE